MRNSTYPFRIELITGGPAGIGDTTACILGDAGVACVVIARRDDRLREVAAKCGSLDVLAGDLTTDEPVQVVEEHIGDANRTIELAVSNGGLTSSGYFDEIEASRLDDEIALKI